MWIIGDIHGCTEQLDELLARLPHGDGLIFLGDYIDRGPDSYGVVERLLREQDRAFFLMGNHEQMMLSFFLGDGNAAWLFPQNGGGATLKSYKMKSVSEFADLPVSHQNFFGSLQLFYETDTFVAVHAGVRVTESGEMTDQDAEDLLWIRSEWIENESKWTGKHIYYGHTPTLYLPGHDLCEPIYGAMSTGIDTGCVYGGCLTAINPYTREIVQVGGLTHER